MQITNSTSGASPSNNYSTNVGSVNQDGQIKSIQLQIENAQKQLQNLSVNKNISYEEKTERRKDLHLQLQNLNQQLAQRKMDIQLEMRAALKAENQVPYQINTDNEDHSAIVTGTMQRLIGADASLKQISTLQAAKNMIEGKSAVLESEIRIDKSRGGSTENKEAELAKLNDRISAASAEIMDKMYVISEGLETKDSIVSGQGEDIKGDTTNTAKEKNIADRSDIFEKKNGSIDKSVLYIKTGEASRPEAEEKISLLV